MIGTEWAVAIPTIITAVSIPVVAALIWRTGRTLKDVATRVTAIDHAVNGQPEGDPPMVEKVSNIVTEQIRVANELRDSKSDDG